MPIRCLSASSPGVLTKVLKDWRSEQAAQKNTGHYLETPAVQWADLAWDLFTGHRASAEEVKARRAKARKRQAFRKTARDLVRAWDAIAVISISRCPMRVPSDDKPRTSWREWNAS